MQKLKSVFTPFKRSKYNVEQNSSCLRVKCVHCNVEKADAQSQTSDILQECSRTVTNQFVQVNITPSRIPRLIATPYPNDSVRYPTVLSSQCEDGQSAEREKFSPTFSRSKTTAGYNLDRNSPKKISLFLANEKSKANYGSESDLPISDSEDVFKVENEESQLPPKGGLRARKTRKKSYKIQNSNDNDCDLCTPSTSPSVNIRNERVNSSSPQSGIPVPVKSCERSKTYIFEQSDLSKSPEKTFGEDISLRPNYKIEKSIYAWRDKSHECERSDVKSTPKKTVRLYKEAEDSSGDILEADSGTGMACGDSFNWPY